MISKDFELIARVIAECRRSAMNRGEDPVDLDEVALGFALELRATNPNFNRDRFLRACGVED